MLLTFFRFFKQQLWLVSADIPLMFATFVGMVVFAFIEGIGIALLVPLLDQSGNASMNIPLLGNILPFFQADTVSDRVFLVGQVMLAVILVRGGAQFGVNALKAWLPLRVSKRIMAHSFSQMVKSNLGHMHSRTMGEHNVVVNSFSNQISTSISMFLTILSSGIILLVYATMMFIISWKMALASFLALAFLSYVIKAVVERPTKVSSEKLNEQTVELNIQLTETIIGGYLIRLKGAEKLRINQFADVLNRVLIFQLIKQLWANVPASALPTGAGALVCLLIMFMAEAQRGADDGWLPLVIMFIVIMFRLLAPVSEIITSYTYIVAIEPIIEKVQTYWRDCEAERQKTGSLSMSGMVEAITFENVCFNYEGADDPALNNISLNLTKKKRIALVGPSGGGKSTIVNLIMGFYPANSGSILVDGVSLSEIDIYQWRRRIGLVEQTPFFFNKSIRKNLCFGESDVSDNQIWAALEQAGASQFVRDLNEGLETLIGDQGVRLSGGQKQRLAIARAILSKPDVLILDEATSQLDSISQSVVQSCIDNLPEDITLMSIAHRLSTVTNADEILVLKQGSIVQRGTHAELMEQGGLYREMVQHQELS